MQRIIGHPFAVIRPPWPNRHMKSSSIVFQNRQFQYRQLELPSTIDRQFPKGLCVIRWSLHLDLLMLNHHHRRPRPGIVSATGLYSTRSAPSNHASTAKTLASREIQLKSVSRRRPRDVEVVWTDLYETLLFLDGSFNIEDGKRRRPSVLRSLKTLTKPLTKAYKSEEDFDTALFESLRRCLKEFELKQGDENAIILQVGNSNNDNMDEICYAVGIARQSAVAKDLHGEIVGKRGSMHSKSSGMKDFSSPDHAVCLFEKDSNNGQWNIKDCLAVVELKLRNSSCYEFNHIVNGKVASTDLEHQHGPLGQAILYSMGCVLPCHARRGVLGDRLPLAIIAGKNEKRSKPDNHPGHNQRSPSRLRWVSGRVNIPEACGDRFSYSVEDFGPFYNERNKKEEEETSIKNALSVYLDTVLFGLRAAIQVQNNLALDVVPRPPTTASGQSLLIDGEKLNVHLRASPIFGANPIQAPNDDDGGGGGGQKWSVSQGELFAGRLNVSKLLSQPLRQSAAHLHIGFMDDKFGRKLDEKIDVVVKVSSCTVHQIFVHPHLAFVAINLIKGDANLAKEIGTVLFAVIKKSVGLITIMADLSKQGYHLVKPREVQREKLAVLWLGYRDLVKNLLLPMAEVGVVHPDIRPGFDVTSNILYKVNDDNGVSIKLIDYDSLVFLQDYWGTAPLDDGRYIRLQPDWNATTFVWWQSICLVYAWHHELDATILQHGDHFMELVEDYYGSRSMIWWKEVGDFCADNSTTIDSEYVNASLAKLDKIF